MELFTLLQAEWKKKEQYLSLIYGMRGEIKPTILNGLEIGFFRVMQLGGEGRPEGF